MNIHREQDTDLLNCIKESEDVCMKKFLIVVDMQKDFVDGSLGTDEAVNIIPKLVKKIEDFDGEMIATLDTHYDDYLDTLEGKNLPIMHCIKGTDGWCLDTQIEKALEKKGYTRIEKNTFGSVDLPSLIKQKAGDKEFTLELTGLCTDICVISNALILKAYFPEVQISVDSACCAGVTVLKHKAALEAMRSCQIVIK